MGYAVYMDNFTSGLDDLTRKQQGDPAIVLAVLDKHKRFSVFEATANDRIARMMDLIFKRGYVRDIGGGFPWTNVEITEAGRALMNYGRVEGAPATKGGEQQ